MGRMGRIKASVQVTGMLEGGKELLKRLRDAINPRDIFHCGHCNRKSPGQRCTICADQPAKGTYYDNNGYPCKPTARKPPTSGMTGRPRPRGGSSVDKTGLNVNTGLYKKTLHSRDQVARAMDALDVLGKTYRVTKSKVETAPIHRENEWVVEELPQGFEGKECYSGVDLSSGAEQDAT